MKSVKIGFAPTRRSIFSAPDAVKYANLTRERLKELGAEFVDITDINEEGLFYDEADREKIQEKFRRENVKGIFFPHGNFGTEYVCARMAKEMGLPVLLWGPRDERPDENGVRLRDSQCGLFATGKVLRRFGVPFTYMTNCRLTDPEFERGIKDFLAVCNVVDTFRHTRILQIGPRPFDFWSTMCNEGELLEKFNIQLSPIPLPELTAEMKKVKAEGSEVEKVVAYCNTNMCVKIKPEELENVAALKVAMKNLAAKYSCNAIAIQCWNALQGEIGIMPCAANSLLNEEGIPVVCETDIHGAITALLVEAAGRNDKRSFFADWTVRHPDNENGELAEGSVWEGAMSAGNYKLDNLCAIVDRNRLQISGNTEDVMKQDSQEERWAAFGWNVLSVPGNDMDALVHAFELAKHCKGKPTVIIANTTKGCGSSVMENKAEWHHKVPTPEEVEQIMKDLEERKEALS